MIRQEPDPRHGADLDVEVYVRANPPDRDQRDALLESLEACLDAGRIEELEVRTWPSSISLTNDLVPMTPAELVQRFDSWAATADVSLQPAFETRTVQSSIVDQRDRILTLPALCVAFYRGEDLVGVFPCSTDDRTVSARDAVDVLADGDIASLPLEGYVPASDRTP